MRRRIVLGVTAFLVAVTGSQSWGAEGAEVFKQQCAKCHGETGASDTAIGKAMKVPALRGDPNVAKESVDEIIASMKANPKHPPTIKSLSDADLRAAAGFAKQLSAEK